MDVLSGKKGIGPGLPEMPYPRCSEKITVATIVHPGVLWYIIAVVLVEIISYAIFFHLVFLPFLRPEGTRRNKSAGAGYDRVVLPAFLGADRQPSARRDHIVVDNKDIFGCSMAAQGEPSEKFEVEIRMYDENIGEYPPEFVDHGLNGDMILILDDPYGLRAVGLIYEALQLFFQVVSFPNGYNDGDAFFFHLAAIR